MFSIDDVQLIGTVDIGATYKGKRDCTYWIVDKSEKKMRRDMGVKEHSPRVEKGVKPKCIIHGLG